MEEASGLCISGHRAHCRGDVVVLLPSPVSHAIPCVVLQIKPRTSERNPKDVSMQVVEFGTRSDYMRDCTESEVRLVEYQAV